MQQEGVPAKGVPDGLPPWFGTWLVEATTIGGLGAFGRLGTGEGEEGREADGDEVGELNRDLISSSSSSSRFNSSNELDARGAGPLTSSSAGACNFFMLSKLMLFASSRGTIESLSSQRSRFCLEAALVDDGGGDGGRGRELIGPNRAAGFLRTLGKIERGLLEGGEDGLLPVDGDAGLLCWLEMVVGDIGLDEFVGDIGLLAVSGGLGGLRLVTGGVGNSCHEDLPPATSPLLILTSLLFVPFSCILRRVTCDRTEATEIGTWRAATFLHTAATLAPSLGAC